MKVFKIPGILGKIKAVDAFMFCAGNGEFLMIFLTRITDQRPNIIMFDGIKLFEYEI